MAKCVHVRPIVPLDVVVVADNLRQGDRDEVDYLLIDPRVGLQESINASVEAWTVTVDGVPAAIFGLAPAGDTAAPWLLATDRFTTAWVGVARRARRVIAKWRKVAPLENWCDSRNAVAVRFLEWLGFTVDHGPNVMVRFTMPQEG